MIGQTECKACRCILSSSRSPFSRFRWVQCQIDTLNQCATRAEVREALDNLPIGLDETYQRILDATDIGSLEGKLALRALVWLVGALRPLRLVEILDGLAIDLRRRTMDHDTGPMHKGALLDACGSLVTYNEDTGILILPHFSVKVSRTVCSV